MTSGYPGQPGYPGYGGYPGYYAMPANGMATAALTLGIIGLCLFWMPFIGAGAAILGVVFGLLGMARAKTIPGRPLYGRAVAGLVTGAIGSVFGIGLTMALFSAADGGIVEINSDPVDGICNEERYLQDPDCG